MPFYGFNHFNGRLKESSHLHPLYPISVNKLDTAEAPKMIWENVNTKPAKTISTSSSSFSTVDVKLLTKFKQFQAKIEKPVYLLGGSPDKILFGISCIALATAATVAVAKLYEMKHRVKN